MSVLEVLAGGPLALLADQGRPGLARLGVTASGAADRRSHALANRLMANPAGAATVEITLGGFTARVRGGDLHLTVTGAAAAVTVDGVGVGLNSVARLTDGQVIAVGVPAAGVRNYLGVRGGIAAEPVLGSRSRDTLSGIGPAPLRAGDLLPVGDPPGEGPPVDLAPAGPVRDGQVGVRAVRGPRDDWFADPGALASTAWTVSGHADRVGVRLLGEPLAWRHPGRQLPSEGLRRGAIQVPPDGRPVIAGPDHPVTGGYPVIGVLLDSDTDILAQLRPGQQVRIGWAPAQPGPR